MARSTESIERRIRSASSRRDGIRDPEVPPYLSKSAYSRRAASDTSRSRTHSGTMAKRCGSTTSVSPGSEMCAWVDVMGHPQRERSEAVLGDSAAVPDWAPDWERDWERNGNGPPNTTTDHGHHRGRGSSL